MASDLTLLGFSDVRGARIECRACHAALSLRLRESRLLVPMACPSCNTDWSALEKAVQAANETLSAIQDWPDLSKSLKPPFDLLLEVVKPSSHS